MKETSRYFLCFYFLLGLVRPRFRLLIKSLFDLDFFFRSWARALRILREQLLLQLFILVSQQLKLCRIVIFRNITAVLNFAFINLFFFDLKKSTHVKWTILNPRKLLYFYWKMTMNTKKHTVNKIKRHNLKVILFQQEINLFINLLQVKKHLLCNKRNLRLG